MFRFGYTCVYLLRSDQTSAKWLAECAPALGGVQWLPGPRALAVSVLLRGRGPSWCPREGLREYWPPSALWSVCPAPVRWFCTGFVLSELWVWPEVLPSSGLPCSHVCSEGQRKVHTWGSASRGRRVWAKAGADMALLGTWRPTFSSVCRESCPAPSFPAPPWQGRATCAVCPQRQLLVPPVTGFLLLEGGVRREGEGLVPSAGSFPT